MKAERTVMRKVAHSEEKMVERMVGWMVERLETRKVETKADQSVEMKG